MEWIWGAGVDTIWKQPLRQLTNFLPGSENGFQRCVWFITEVSMEFVEIQGFRALEPAHERGFAEDVFFHGWSPTPLYYLLPELL